MIPSELSRKNYPERIGIMAGEHVAFELTRTKPFSIPRDHLNLPISWSKINNEPITLGEYVAQRYPSLLIAQGPQMSSQEPLTRPKDLDFDGAKSMTLASLPPSDQEFTSCEIGLVDNNRLRQLIEKETREGIELVALTVLHREFILSCVDSRLVTGIREQLDPADTNIPLSL